jgi:hypothetical protein
MLDGLRIDFQKMTGLLKSSYGQNAAAQKGKQVGLRVGYTSTTSTMSPRIVVE